MYESRASLVDRREHSGADVSGGSRGPVGGTDAIGHVQPSQANGEITPYRSVALMLRSRPKTSQTAGIAL